MTETLEWVIGHQVEFICIVIILAVATNYALSGLRK